MDWLVDDQMMRQWEELSKEEEKITLTRNEGRTSKKRMECNMYRNKWCNRRR